MKEYKEDKSCFGSHGLWNCCDKKEAPIAITHHGQPDELNETVTDE